MRINREVIRWFRLIHRRYAAVLVGALLAGMASCKDGRPDREDSGSVQRTEVQIEGRQLLVNGAPYRIKGICYFPVPKGRDTVAVFDRLDEDLALMKEAGINTIRTYSPIEEERVLDRMAEEGIRVIIGFGYDPPQVRYNIRSGNYREYVLRFKEHPAILFWELGNEYNFHPEWFGGDIRNWYRDMNEAARSIHELDPGRPVSTAHGELPDELALSMGSEIDIWGMNVYRWDNPSSIFAEWKEVSGKPMYLSEAGADSFNTPREDKNQYATGPNEQMQADANEQILKEVFADQEVNLGVALFSFVDEWWKAGQPDLQDPGGFAPGSVGVPYDATANEEYWGIVDIDRNKKLTFEVVKKIYNGAR